LKKVIFGSSASINFAVSGYEELDPASLYDHYTSSSRDSWRPTPVFSGQSPSRPSEHLMSGGLLSPSKFLQSFASAKSLSVGFVDLGVPAANVKPADAKYGEGSAPNKRPHVEKGQSTLAQQPTQTAGDRVKAKKQKKVGKKIES